MRPHHINSIDALGRGFDRPPVAVPSSDHSGSSLSKFFYTHFRMSLVSVFNRSNKRKGVAAPLYTADEKMRRDSSGWTIVQGVLAPLQFLVFLVSLSLVFHYLLTGEGLRAASISILVKTFFLLAIMVTGAIWEKVVFGRYLFAPAFFWEDVFSILVIALHTIYCVALVAGYGSARQQMVVALAAYCAYVINAAQFLLKLRAARLQQKTTSQQNVISVGGPVNVEAAQ